MPGRCNKPTSMPIERPSDADPPPEKPIGEVLRIAVHLCKELKERLTQLNEDQEASTDDEKKTGLGVSIALIEGCLDRFENLSDEFFRDLSITWKGAMVRAHRMPDHKRRELEEYIRDAQVHLGKIDIADIVPGLKKTDSKE